MEDNAMEQRILEIEHILTKLVTIQEEQTKQTEKIIASVDKFSSMALLVEQNGHDINNISERVTQFKERFHKEKEDMTKKINTNRIELDEIGQGRLWKGLSTAVAIIIFAFGYLYSDLKGLNEFRREHIERDVKMQVKIQFLEKQVDTLTDEYRAHARAEKIKAMSNGNYGRTQNTNGDMSSK